ncbi:hypothetical protein ADK60_30025 [Streptomyces sp. XY431]|uniref:hypothetical protein n=1 Tax=Streptomycetaceae TaxID=2062 RepID=UPI0006B03AE7|nr:hypothetical protein [Streptomyces sp. XY431]KOV13333.1 hypothetical protein ADK60_30025 [Streptomyces sp. XY431]
MTSSARRPLGTSPQSDSAAHAPAPARPAWPLLPDPAPAVEDVDQADAEPTVPAGRRQLWTGPRG